MTDPSPWWDRDIYADRRPFLLARGRILSALRDWFRRRGFLEVETPALQVSPGNEIHLHAFATELATPGGGRAPLYLHTSPEFTCKKLLAAGEPRIFSLAHVFRNRERGPLHHPEFTMLEWYRTNEPYEALMEDCAAHPGRSGQGGRQPATAMEGPHRRSLRRARAAHASPTRSRNSPASICWRRSTAAKATATSSPPRRARPASRSPTTTTGPTSSAACWSNGSSRSSATAGPTLLDRYPLPEAAWAQRAADPRLAQRFELYACGVELANGFAEITDAAEQRRRFEEAMAERQRRYGEQYPIDEDFLAALAAMPPASGIALGFDRLVMLATGAPRIEQVLWAPVAGDDR